MGEKESDWEVDAGLTDLFREIMETISCPGCREREVYLLLTSGAKNATDKIAIGQTTPNGDFLDNTEFYSPRPQFWYRDLSDADRATVRNSTFWKRDQVYRKKGL